MIYNILPSSQIIVGWVLLQMHTLYFSYQLVYTILQEAIMLKTSGLERISTAGKFISRRARKGALNLARRSSMAVQPSDTYHKVNTIQSRLLAKQKKKNGVTKQAKIELDIDLGDTLLMGRFKNSPKVVKSISTDAKGQLEINGRKALTFRIKKLMPEKIKKKAEVSIGRRILDCLVGIHNT